MKQVSSSKLCDNIRIRMSVFCRSKMKNKNHQNYCSFMTWRMNVEKNRIRISKKAFCCFFKALSEALKGKKFDSNLL